MGLFDIMSILKDGQEIIKITLAGGSEKPYYIKSEKGCFIRIGTAAKPMPRKMIDELYSKRTRSSIRTIKSNHQTLKFEQLKIYYQESGKKLNQQFASNLELTTEDGLLNYVAYMLSDGNTISIKVAKFKGKDRVDLIENNEYGNCSLIKAAKLVLDKIDLENKTITEITSSGGLPSGLSQTEFFEGYSVPRNKKIMRVFKDLRLVEQLGSGVPRILKSYNKACFKFSDNFLRMTLPKSIGGQINDLTDKQQKVLQLITTNHKITRKELAEKLQINTSAVQKHLSALKDKKYLERIGGTRGYSKTNIPT